MPINKYFLKGSETTQLIMLSPDDNKMSDKGKNFHDCIPDWTIYKKGPGYQRQIYGSDDPILVLAISNCYYKWLLSIVYEMYATL